VKRAEPLYSASKPKGYFGNTERLGRHQELFQALGTYTTVKLTRNNHKKASLAHHFFFEEILSKSGRFSLPSLKDRHVISPKQSVLFTCLRDVNRTPKTG